MSGIADLAAPFANANKPSVQIQSPFALLQGAADAQNAVNQNRLFQAQTARGNALQQAIDPTTGVVDPLKYNRLVAADPQAAQAAPDAVNQAQNLVASQQGVALKNLQTQNAALGSLQSLNNGAGPTYQQVYDQVALGVKQGWLQPTQANAVLTGMPNGDDPQSMATRNHMIKVMDQQTLDAQQRLTNATPTTGTVNQGPTLQGIQQAPLLSRNPGAITPVGAPIAVGLPTAAQKIQPVAGPASPTGQPTTTTLGNSLRLQGLDGNGNPLPNPAFQNLPPGLRNPNAPPPAGTPIATGAGPAANNAMAATGTSSSGAYQAISDAAAKAVGQRALLQNMASDATRFQTGPLTPAWKSVKATVQQLGSIFGLAPVDADKLAANEDLDKIAAQLADAQGAGSNARLEVNQGANPSIHNTPAGLHLILGKLTGNADYLAARGQLAAQYQQTQDPTSANSRQFEAQIGSQLDPRVFQFNRLNQPEKANYLSELPSDEARTKFKMDFLKTRAAGLLPNG